MKIARAAAISGILLFFSTVWASAVDGIPKVVDGDTITIDDVKIRLEGIDAPETDQICLDGKGARWTCGIDARDKLSLHIGGRSVSCRSNGTDAYGRSLATCLLRGENLNEWLVREGWAVAYVKYSSAYIATERDARERQRGLWQGAFIAPWDWRNRNQQTKILGALKVPLDAQKLLLAPTGAEEAPSAGCNIKGNISRNGERIYHMPHQKHYAQINMGSARDKRWFCTPAEAEAAGWRRSKN